MPVIDPERWRVLEPLLDRALDLSAEEQHDWLAELQTSDPALAAELAALLASEATADRRGFLADPVEVTLAGRALGPWTLERPLGHGGMGSVWLARRTDGRFDGYAAVKLLDLARLSATGRERFRREGSALARLTHPGIARLFDAGTTAQGQPYLVMEHVDGRRIDEHADALALDREARVRLVLQVLAAVGHAHANLVVHRDLKPSNILVTARGEVKLLDFGIAKLLDDDAVVGATAALTQEGTRALTPHFAAPEQVRGDAVTTATDVYAAGVLLHLLVSGRHPTAEGCRTPAEVVRALLDVEPARLGLGDLDTVLARALAKAPAERYQTASALADDLERWLRHEPVRARPASAAYRARKFLRRHRAGVTVGVAVAAGLLAATAVSVRQTAEARRQRDAAVYASRRADAQVEFQSLLMSQVGNEPLTMRQILDGGRAVLERQYAGDQRFLAPILVQLATRYAELGDEATRGALLARAESVAVAGGHAELLPEVRCHAGDRLRTQGRYDDARRTLHHALALLRARPDAESEVLCLRLLAGLEQETGNVEQGAAAIRQAIAIRDREGGRDDMAYVDLLSTLAASLHGQRREREAVDIMRRAVALLDSTGRGRLMMSGVLRHNLAYLLASMGETREALALGHDVLEHAARGDTTGRLPTQPLILYAHTALGAGELDSARKYFTALADQVSDDEDPYWEGRALFGLVQAEARLGRLDDARRTADRFRLVADNPDLRNSDDQQVDVRVVDAWLALAAGDTAGAHAHVMRVLNEGDYMKGRRARLYRVSLILAAETALATGRADDALRLARDARTIATRDSLSGSRSAHAGEAMLVEGRALLATGDTAAARAAIEQARTALRHGAGEAHPRTRAATALLATLAR